LLTKLTGGLEICQRMLYIKIIFLERLFLILI